MQNIWQFQKIVVPLHPLKKKHRGVEQLVARQAHNLEVACSSPASATTKSDFCRTSFFIYVSTFLQFLPFGSECESVADTSADKPHNPYTD